VKEQWQGRFPEAPVGMVITHLASEHADFVPAAERTEQATKGFLSEQAPQAPARPYPDMYQAFFDGSWKQKLQGVAPETGEGGLLVGVWGDLVAAATCIEQTEDWQGRGITEPPAGQVIDFMWEAGLADFVPVAERTEQDCRAKGCPLGYGAAYPDMYEVFLTSDWKQVLTGYEVAIDTQGLLRGPWGAVIAAAVRVEHVDGWQGRFSGPPVGMVIDHLIATYPQYVPNAERTEQACKAAL